ncbi:MULTISPECIES: hypothetical protein [Lactobacillus]|uniref:hypothetical protein n=1 Tax=Lactobacillus TaxID=1578 RepID=UPI000FD7E081|nr:MULTISPECIES: hypothetical protein [Lactobacillus]RVU71935.1 hypothetical protein EJK20_11135 [Lactobacillus xujianguonis]
MAKSDIQEVTPYFLELKAAHERLVDKMVKEAFKDNRTYGEVKDYINAQLDLVPNSRYFRKDDLNMFYGLVSRAVSQVRRIQDKLEVPNYDSKEDDGDTKDGKDSGKDDGSTEDWNA